MSHTKPMANNQQASARSSTSTALVLFAPEKTDKTETHDGQDGRTKEPKFLPVTPENGEMDSSSESSSTATPSSPTLPPVKPRAYYRVTRLPPGEIEHRAAMGRCTYCDDDTHSRTTCASGRLMRRVPKRVLNTRLGHSVCPFCGDPDHDRHCKATCPLRIKLQEVLDAKEAAFRSSSSTLNPNDADAARRQPTAADAIIAALERQSERELTSFAYPSPPRYNNRRPSRTQRSDWRGFSARNEERKHAYGQDKDKDKDQDQDFSHNAPLRKKTYLKRPPMSKTNAPWRAGLVHSVPVPEADPVVQRHSAAEQDQVDLIDLDMDMDIDMLSPSGSSTDSSTDSDTNNSATSTPLTIPNKEVANDPSGTNFKRLKGNKASLPPPPPFNLLDTEVTEVVWNNIVIPPSNAVGDCEKGNLTASDTTSYEEYGGEEDLIDWGIDLDLDVEMECK